MNTWNLINWKPLPQYIFLIKLKQTMSSANNLVIVWLKQFIFIPKISDRSMPTLMSIFLKFIQLWICKVARIHVARSQSRFSNLFSCQAQVAWNISTATYLSATRCPISNSCTQIAFFNISTSLCHCGHVNIWLRNMFNFRLLFIHVIVESYVNSFRKFWGLCPAVEIVISDSKLYHEVSSRNQNNVGTVGDFALFVLIGKPLNLCPLFPCSTILINVHVDVRDVNWFKSCIYIIVIVL